jgi:DNA primase
MESVVDEIKEKLDIVQIVSEYVSLKKVGSNFRALCPFHSEKNPSFYVSPARQIFKCFGCGASGDIFKFIMLIEGVEFKEALKILAQKAGIELKLEPKSVRTEKEKILEICELACRFFTKQLKKTKKGEEILKYLLNRGLTQESIEKWRIGYAPETWRGLYDFLIEEGYKKEEIVKSGLAVMPEDSPRPYDRFRGRIIFPIFDIQGRVVGFGGRIRPDAKEDEAKYINTPNTLIYDKSKILYGLNNAKVPIRREDRAIIVEGYFDVILSSQSGAENVVATSGSALTEHHLKVLSRYTKNLVLAFDMDIGGEEATKRGIDLAQMLGFNIQIASLPQGKDPADVIKENSANWFEILKNSKEIVHFYFEKLLEKFDKNTLSGKKEIARNLLPYIARIQDNVEQSAWIRKLARELDVREEALWTELQKVSLKKEEVKKPEEISIQTSQKAPPEELIERGILLAFLGLKEKGISKEEEEKLIQNLKEIAPFFGKERETLRECFVLQKKIPKELEDFYQELLLEVEIKLSKVDKENLFEDFHFCTKRLQKIKQKKLIQNLTSEIKNAEKAGDKEKLKELLKKLKEIKKL